MTVVRLPQLSLQWLPIECDARRLFAYYVCEFNHTTPQKFYENVSDIYALAPGVEQCEGNRTFIGKPITRSMKGVCFELLSTGSSMNTTSSYHHNPGTFENFTSLFDCCCSCSFVVGGAIVAVIFVVGGVFAVVWGFFLY